MTRRPGKVCYEPRSTLSLDAGIRFELPILEIEIRCSWGRKFYNNGNLSVGAIFHSLRFAKSNGRVGPCAKPPQTYPGEALPFFRPVR